MTNSIRLPHRSDYTQLRRQEPEYAGRNHDRWQGQLNEYCSQVANLASQIAKGQFVDRNQMDRIFQDLDKIEKQACCTQNKQAIREARESLKNAPAEAFDRMMGNKVAPQERPWQYIPDLTKSLWHTLMGGLNLMCSMTRDLLPPRGVGPNIVKPSIPEKPRSGVVVSANLRGPLGDQLFQVATARSHKKNISAVDDWIKAGNNSPEAPPQTTHTTAQLSEIPKALVTLPCNYCGMFSVMHYLLGVMRKFEEGNYSGIEVNFEKNGTYYDSNYGDNWLSYYFEPIKVGESNSVKNTATFDFDSYVSLAYSAEETYANARKEAHVQFQKYFKLKKPIQEKIDLFAEEHFKDKPIIAVHYRGTDKGREAPIVPYDTMIAEIRKGIKEANLDDFKIFLATDEAQFVDRMNQEFPGLIITTNAKRSTNGINLHNHAENRYESGLEALTDCFLLGHRNVKSFIRTSSNLGKVAMYLNSDMRVIEVSQRFKPMVVKPCSGVLVTGDLHCGLGNRLHKISTIYAYALDTNAEAVFPNKEVDHDFEYSPVLARVPYFEGPMPNLPKYEERFDGTFLSKENPQSVEFKGAFLSPDKFKHRQKELAELFAPSPEILQDLQEKHKDLLSKNTVAVHVRRGDFLKHKTDEGELIYYNLAEESDYYAQAVKEFDAENDQFVVFTNDVEFTKNLPVFKDLKNITFITGQKTHEDFYLMWLCKNYIIANSTFSFMAAFLGQDSSKKVVMPVDWFGPEVSKKWFPKTTKYPHISENILMDGWVKIGTQRATT